ncbi:MAG: hypothetical protein A2790_09835 [Phenylobacterium sp. RIFCSPHIGHO2_01_FULL_69_31]|uniref:hypothetical protein n=1 Tax=Phenylobacterium sp. RIFCSPHIGHO2_01_FULL_69_31 TaxID=1801944 RepID=UPI0008CCABCD|nr:hypothetical protein [Phenylobacterium sp. RIFCSPHIGHO2_01_FULL_69_31]OHB30953.1 MAG: hypothetical protein A2790_09835 [Phenylobacterium sp. RIFCSPHIGHO2_01_FULL_69_31]
MRIALSSLILVAGIATAAQAQDPAAQPAPPAAPTTAAPASATPAPADAAQPAPAAPAAEAPAAPPAEPAPPPPTLPTSGYGFEAIQVIEKICIPAVRGQGVDPVAKANGFKMNRRDQTWAKPFGTENKAYQVIVFPSGSNKSVCNVELRYPVGAAEDIAKALNVWAFVQQPPLDPTANYTQPQDPDGLKRVRRSWEYLTTNRSIGLNYSTVRKPDDSQVNAKYDMGTLQYQERTF